MQITYTAISSDGKKYTDTAEAEDKYELARMLKEKGETLVSTEDGSEKSAFAQWFERVNTATQNVKLKEKIFLAQNLAAMLSAGLSISRALSISERQTKNKKFKRIISELNQAVQQGQTFSDGLQKYPKVFPPVFVSMVRAGEESGKLPESLITVANQMEQSYQLKRKVLRVLLKRSMSPAVPRR